MGDVQRSAESREYLPRLRGELVQRVPQVLRSALRGCSATRLPPPQPAAVAADAGPASDAYPWSEDG